MLTIDMLFIPPCLKREFKSLIDEALIDMILSLQTDSLVYKTLILK